MDTSINKAIYRIGTRNMDRNTITTSDALTYLRSLSDESVNCIITSPPYYGLRDYGVTGQLGLEETPAKFIQGLVEVFREAMRVLRSDGTCWINMGDSYANDTKWGGKTTGKHAAGLQGTDYIGRRRTNTGLPSKSVMGIPWRLAFGLQDDGWILRSDIIWHKPNPMPESVTDRPTKAHEYVFLLSKRQSYWYDSDAVQEPSIYPDDNRKARANSTDYQTRSVKDRIAAINPLNARPYPMRNRRTVWTVATEPTPFAHFATFPQKLIEPMILAGCPDKVCSTCGKPWARIVETRGGTTGKSWHNHSDDLGKGMSQYSELQRGGVGKARDANGIPYQRIDMGVCPTCKCNAPTHPGLVLDPFMGSGTTALVARRLGRHYIGSELNTEYAELARKRLANSDPFQHREVAPGVVQMSLFTA